MTSNAIINVPAPAASGPSVFTPVFTDNFTRADEDPMSTNGWSDNRQVSGHLFLVGNIILVNDTTSNAHEINSAVVNADHYAQIDVTVTGGIAGSGYGIQLCGTAGADTDKYLILANATTVTVETYLTGVFATIATRSVTWSGGDTLRAAKFGTSIYVYQNGVQLGAAIVDTSLSGGKAGMAFRGDVTSGSMDNFVCGNVT